MKKIEKVDLMYPNPRWTKFMERTIWRTHPYNLGLLAAMIENKYDVNITDANFNNLSEENFARLVGDRQPDVLGISTMTNEYTHAGLTAARITKENSPQTKVVMGGVGVISDSSPFIDSPYTDAVVIGEGEYAFKDFCNFLNGKGPFPEKGVLYKEEDKLRGSGRVDFIKNLDKLPLPAYHLVDFNRYSTQMPRECADRPREIPYGRIFSSRGCPNHCCFCEVESISGRTTRFRSIENVAKEIEWLIKDYGVKFLVFDDDNLTTNRKRAKDFFKMMIERKYNLKWNAATSAIFTYDDEMLDLMKESGCQYLGVSVESGSPRVLKDIIHKPINLENTKEMIKKIKGRNIDVRVSFVFGFPGETWDEIRQTFKYAEEIEADACSFFPATPLPNTELYRMAKEGGYLRSDFSFNQHLWTEGWIDTDEFRHQDLKILKAYEWDRINFSTPEKKKKFAQMWGITEGRLEEIRKDSLKIVNP